MAEAGLALRKGVEKLDFGGIKGFGHGLSYHSISCFSSSIYCSNAARALASHLFHGPSLYQILVEVRHKRQLYCALTRELSLKS